MRRAALISGTYAVAGGAWILGSDLLFLPPGDGYGPLLAGMVKGLGFVAVTAIILYGALLALYGRHATLARSLAAAALVKEVERRRRELARVFLARVVEATADYVWLFDAERRIVSGNQAGWRAIGRDPPEGPVSIEEAGWPEEHRAQMAELVDSAVVAGETRSGRIAYLRGGRAHTVDFTISPIADPETEGRCALFVAHDVTELLAAEEARQRANRILRAVVASLSAINRARDRKTLADEVTRALHDEAGFGVVWIGLATHDNELPITPIAVSGASLEDVRKLVGAASANALVEYPPLAALQSGQVVVSPDLSVDPNFAPLHDLIAESGFRSAIAFPLIVAGNSIATLAIYTHAVTYFSDEEIAPLATLAENLAYAFTGLDSLVRYEESEAGRLAAMSRAKEMLIETIGALAGVVEVRDPYTAGHQQRVATLSTAIARRKGWTEDRIEGVRLGALIHDIGKIGIPAELLVKPGRLTEEEFALIRTHAIRGGEMIKDLHFDWPIFDMVTQHHERLDGSGYPGRLRDNEITPEAKVIAVADVADAMLWQRPYRAPKSIEDVVRELSAGRGVLYEREAVDICLALLAERGLAIFEEADEAPATADGSKPAAA